MMVDNNNKLCNKNVNSTSDSLIEHMLDLRLIPKFQQKEVVLADFIKVRIVSSIFSTWMYRFCLLLKSGLLYISKDSHNTTWLAISPSVRMKSYEKQNDENHRYILVIYFMNRINKLEFAFRSFAKYIEWHEKITRVAYRKLGGGIFGQSLTETIMYGEHEVEKKIPRIVIQCCEFIKLHGLDQFGIFREPGNFNTLKKIKMNYDRGNYPILDPEMVSTATIASLLKIYLFSLPDSVIPKRYGPQFADIGREIDQKIITKKEAVCKLKDIIENELPKENVILLKYMCEFMNQVASHSDKNQMNSSNLAKVFGPTILQQDNQLDLNRAIAINTWCQITLKILIDYWKIVFDNKDNSFTIENDDEQKDKTKSRVLKIRSLSCHDLSEDVFSKSVKCEKNRYSLDFKNEISLADSLDTQSLQEKSKEEISPSNHDRKPMPKHSYTTVSDTRKLRRIFTSAVQKQIYREFGRWKRNNHEKRSTSDSIIENSQEKSQVTMDEKSSDQESVDIPALFNQTRQNNLLKVQDEFIQYLLDSWKQDHDYLLQQIHELREQLPRRKA